MANNEHKNLSNANLHVPKDFSTASNSTTLTKNSSGNLSWISNTDLGKQRYNITGYSLTSDHSNSNYHRAAHMTDGQSPNQYNIDTSQTVVTNIVMQPSMLITRSANIVVDQDSTVYKIYGWLNSSGTNSVTLAIAKVTPEENNAANLNPVVIDEITVDGLGSSQKLIQINETTITSASLTAGDYLIAFIKETTEAEMSNVYWQVQICTTTY
tara:strand:+ start:113 stop:748 length:636 start_codon:yes stop_codon:yes gene_type:complete